MSKLKIAVIQYDIVWENLSENIQRIIEIVKNSERADIYVLPEMFNTGFTNDVASMAENLDGDTISTIKNLAKEQNAAICGSIILNENDNYFNSFLFIKPDGEIVRYDKRHLFKMGGEADMFTKGNERVICNYKDVRFLLQVCYDLRFPVWSRNRNDYDAIIYIANWPASRQEIFKTLLKARAIENQALVIAANRIGTDGNNINYEGGSCFVDAKGVVVNACNQNSEEVIFHNFDLSWQNTFRKDFPAWQDADDFSIIFSD
ncbi:MAG: amidohydrolase [Bacteroidales bacterium]|nr:amidohydrolase [Bacteroidales bacterium]